MSGFKYVNVTTPGCAGWLNLFFDEYCVALVNSAKVANQMRKVIPPATNKDKLTAHVETWIDVHERQPEIGLTVLCYEDTGDYFEAKFYGFNDDMEQMWSCPYNVSKWLDGPLAEQP